MASLEASEQDTFLSQFVQFRNPQNHPGLIVQMMMVVASFLILVGILYVIFLLGVIAVHHYLYDRDPHKIPDYVRKSNQFSSDDEDEAKLRALGKANIIRAPAPSISVKSSSESDEQWQKAVGPTASKKGVILDKFLHEGEWRGTKRE